MSGFDDRIERQLAALATTVPPIAVPIDTVKRAGRRRRRQRRGAVAVISFTALLVLGTTVSVTGAGSTTSNDTATPAQPRASEAHQVAMPSPTTDAPPPQPNHAPNTTNRFDQPGESSVRPNNSAPATSEPGRNDASTLPTVAIPVEATPTAPTTPPPTTAPMPVPTGPLKVSASRSNELAANEQIVVTGEGYAPNHAISVGQCVAFVTLEAYANCAVLGSVTSDADGRFKVTVTVHRQLVPFFGMRGADCAQALCGIAASHDRISRSRPWSFAPVSFASVPVDDAPATTAPAPPEVAASPRTPSTPADAPTVSPPVTEVPPVKVRAPESPAAQSKNPVFENPVFDNTVFDNTEPNA